MKINVNGIDHSVAHSDVTYEDIAELAGRPGAKELTVTYFWRGPGDITRSGTIIPGKRIVGKDGMQFTAVHTGDA